MRIIPAIDLMGGVVVHGVAGRRAEYRPLVSTLAADAQPINVARGLIDTRGLSEFYVADLDAIGGREPDWDSYQRLIQCGATLWIDAGVSNLDRAAALKQFADDRPAVTGIIVGSESLAASDELHDVIALIGLQRFVFSLDLVAGVVRTAAPLGSEPGASGTSPRQRLDSSPGHPDSAQRIVADVVASGIRRLIVLDVAAVGLGQGCPTLDLCRELRQRYSDLEITSGGGVRTMADLEQMAVTGCDVALVATALHDGRIGRAEPTRSKSAGSK